MCLHSGYVDLLCDQKHPNHGLLRITSAVNARVVILYTLYAFFSTDFKWPFLKETGNVPSTSSVSGAWPGEFDNDDCGADEDHGVNEDCGGV